MADICSDSGQDPLVAFERRVPHGDAANQAAADQTHHQGAQGDSFVAAVARGGVGAEDVATASTNTESFGEDPTHSGRLVTADPQLNVHLNESLAGAAAGDYVVELSTQSSNKLGGPLSLAQVPLNGPEYDTARSQSELDSSVSVSGVSMLSASCDYISKSPSGSSHRYHAPMPDSHSLDFHPRILSGNSEGKSCGQNHSASKSEGGTPAVRRSIRNADTASVQQGGTINVDGAEDASEVVGDAAAIDMEAPVESTMRSAMSATRDLIRDTFSYKFRCYADSTVEWLNKAAQDSDNALELAQMKEAVLMLHASSHQHAAEAQPSPEVNRLSQEVAAAKAKSSRRAPERNPAFDVQLMKQQLAAAKAKSQLHRQLAEESAAAGGAASGIIGLPRHLVAPSAHAIVKRTGAPAGPSLTQVAKPIEGRAAAQVSHRGVPRSALAELKPTSSTVLSLITRLLSLVCSAVTQTAADRASKVAVEMLAEGEQPAAPETAHPVPNLLCVLSEVFMNVAAADHKTPDSED